MIHNYSNMTNDDLKYKPTGYSYRVDENVWAGEYPVWEWEQGAGMRQLRSCFNLYRQVFYRAKIGCLFIF